MVYIHTMHQVNLNGIDLNLLPPLSALLSERNVTRAAAKVGMSQPAMSRALARLRALLGDPLLLRGRGGLLLTPRAQALVPVVGKAVAELAGVFAAPRFDPAAASRLVRLAASDAQAVLLGPVLMARLRREAPNVAVQIVGYSADLGQRMDDGRIDLAFALATTPLPAGARSMPVAVDRLAVVMRRGHPAAARPWRMADYARFDHATVSILGDASSEMDAALAKAGITRRVAFTSPHFTAALAVVARTDMVTTISQAFARRFARPFGLLVKPAPLPEAALPLVLVWSHIREHDPLLAWFRDLVADVARSAGLGGIRTIPGRRRPPPRLDE
ncbi:MAG: LysR substrate-binding domain-containing protein [Hyphomicrobiaceae bacterium]|nr:LysR substrate-binding domain-containing protein [Hyphomicrobiaceae bacterium]